MAGRVVELRARIHAKFGGRCAYCGEEITVKKMQVDHFVPLHRGASDANLNLEWMGIKRIERGTDAEENLFPACGPCNRLKSSYALEEFRKLVDWNSESLRRYDCQYRHLLRFKRITETTEPVIFWFERPRPLGETVSGKGEEGK